MNKPDTITALYCRLSQEDALDGDSNSIGEFTPQTEFVPDKNEIPQDFI